MLHVLTAIKRIKANQLNEMAAIHDKLSNQARFILSVIAGHLVISKRKKADVVMEMRKMDFKPIPKVAKKPDGTSPDEDVEEEEEEIIDADESMVGRDTGMLKSMLCATVQTDHLYLNLQTSTTA